MKNSTESIVNIFNQSEDRASEIEDKVDAVDHKFSDILKMRRHHASWIQNFNMKF